MTKNLLFSGLCLSLIFCGCRTYEKKEKEIIDPSKIISTKQSIPLWLEDFGKYKVRNKTQDFVIGESPAVSSIPLAKVFAKENAKELCDLEGDLILHDEFLSMLPNGKYKIAILFEVRKRKDVEIENSSSNTANSKNKLSRFNNTNLDIIKPKKHRYINPSAKRFSEE